MTKINDGGPAFPGMAAAWADQWGAAALDAIRRAA